MAAWTSASLWLLQFARKQHVAAERVANRPNEPRQKFGTRSLRCSDFVCFLRDFCRDDGAAGTLALDPEQTRLDGHEEGKIPLLGEETLRMYPTCKNPFLGKRHALN
jgi:hypothetical protein